VIEVKKIYLVEDEVALNQLIKSYLKDAGYKVISFTNGLDAYQAISSEVDLWILDIMVPGMDGYSLIKEIKLKTAQIPVIFMSARNAELDRVIGLEMGSDDYIAKPFLPRELVLRVNRILKVKKVELSMKLIDFGVCTFDLEKRILKTENFVHQLSVKEYDILKYLVVNKNTAVSRADILDQVWGKDYFGSDRVIDDTLRRLRKKIPELPIETVYGFGYILKVVDE
jgi:two-component system response regulator CssR